MTAMLIGAAVILLGSVVLIIRDVQRSRRAKARQAKKSPAAAPVTEKHEAAEPAPVSLAEHYDNHDLTKFGGALPNIGASEDDPTEGDEPGTDSKAVTLFEGDAWAGVDDPTGPHKLILLHAVGTSDQGKKRQRNEDHYLVLPEQELFMVADGMGGYAGGDVASKLAVNKIAEVFTAGRFGGTPDPNRPRRANELVWAIDEANRAIFEEARAHSEYTGMGTTLLAARFSARKQRLYLGHVGDSRCYRWRDGAMKQLTTDHTLGAKGVTGPLANNIRRALGVAPRVKVDLVIDVPHNGDLYMICSDGLTKMLKDDEIFKVLTTAPTLDGAAQRLVDAANASGGNDNITVVLVSVRDANKETGARESSSSGAQRTPGPSQSAMPG